MADFITNASMAVDANAKPIPVMRPVSTERLAISTTAASAAALNLQTNVVRLVSDVECFIRLDGTATTSNVRLPADSVEYIKVLPQDTISAITASGTGYLYISECV